MKKSLSFSEKYFENWLTLKRFKYYYYLYRLLPVNKQEWYLTIFICNLKNYLYS